MWGGKLEKHKNIVKTIRDTLLSDDSCLCYTVPCLPSPYSHLVHITGLMNLMILSIDEFYFRGKSIFASYTLRSFILLL